MDQSDDARDDHQLQDEIAWLEEQPSMATGLQENLEEDEIFGLSGM